MADGGLVLWSTLDVGVGRETVKRFPIGAVNVCAFHAHQPCLNCRPQYMDYWQITRETFCVRDVKLVLHSLSVGTTCSGSMCGGPVRRAEMCLCAYDGVIAPGN